METYNTPRLISASSSESNNNVVLSPILQDAYKAALQARSSLTSWRTNCSSLKTEEQVAFAKSQGRFAHTNFEYSVILLGSVCLNRKDEDTEKLIKELYKDGFTKVQHGVFSDKPVNMMEAKYLTPNFGRVAKMLEELFNRRPNLREQVRKEWKESKANSNQVGGPFLADQLGTECSFLIHEYTKHAPALGLSIEEYIEFTSILFKICNPVACFGNIDKENYYSIAVDNGKVKVNNENALTSTSLAAKLNSSVDDQPVRSKVICRCNSLHLCIVTEVRYTFGWDNGSLVGVVPPQTRTRIDFCEEPTIDHKICYLTQKDREFLVNYITTNPSFGFYEKKKIDIAPNKGSEAGQPKKKRDGPDEQGWTTVGRKGIR
ncbi:hypothetical protein OROMI_030224 [Orobanche minor]